MATIFHAIESERRDLVVRESNDSTRTVIVAIFGVTSVYRWFIYKRVRQAKSSRPSMCTGLTLVG